jgi:hypothetical protein
MALPSGLWITDVSTTFADATFRLLAAAALDDRTLELGEIRDEEPAAAADALLSQSSVVSADLLYVDDERALLRYETDERGLFDFLGQASIPPEFPLEVENGEMEFTVTATREQFDTFGERLDTIGIRYDLLSVVHGDAREDLLTHRQRECLRVALRMGYFEVPRASPLADVADELGIDTSTASETLRRGSERIIEWFFLGHK